MNDPAPFAYDAVFYPGLAFDQTHPDRLATIATLFGMRPAPPSRCRVLELGCGVGANLIPMAYQHPESEFLGIDLSAPTIAQGQAQIASYGLTNIALRADDIMQVDASFGQFDYIIAHGVYSWVPQAVREKVLAIFGERLSPHGVGFVSYNAYPGSHVRDLGRRMMHFHTRASGDAASKVRQGRALLRFVVDAADPAETYSAAVGEALARATEKSDEVLYHDDLNADAKAFLFHRVIAAAEREGLQYLSESPLARSTFGNLPEYTQPLLDRIPEEQVTVREQYLDLLVGRWFRETLFCRSDVVLTRAIDPQIVSALSISADLRASSVPLRLEGGGEEIFKNEKDDAIGVDDPLAKAAFLYLGRVWPRAVDFPSLVRGAAEILAKESEVGPHGVPPVETLAVTLLRAYAAGMLNLHVEAPRLTEAAGKRPVASVLARRQAEAGPIVTNLRHVTIKLTGALHPFVLLVDGTRGVDELAPELERFLVEGAGKAEEDDAPFTPAESEEAARARAAQALDVLAKLGLLLP